MGEKFKRLAKRWRELQTFELAFPDVDRGYFMTWRNRRLWETVANSRDRLSLICGMVAVAQQMQSVRSDGWLGAACSAIGLGAYAHVIAHCDGVALHPIASRPKYTPRQLAALLTIAPYDARGIHAAASTSLYFANLIFSSAIGNYIKVNGKGHLANLNDVVTSELLRGWL